jgi:hypothetical protein
VEWIVRTPADFYTVRAVIDNQELDSRASTGAIYWEGLSELRDSNGRLAGHGYLEMTGYAAAAAPVAAAAAEGPSFAAKLLWIKTRPRAASYSETESFETVLPWRQS